MNYGHTQVQLPNLSLVNKIIIIISVALFIIDAIVQKLTGVSLVLFLGLSAKMFAAGFINQIVTYPFIGRGLLEVVFNGVLLWFIGSELESQWGPKRYIGFLLTSTIGGGIIFLILSVLLTSGSVTLLAGMGGLASALCLGYAIIYPDRPFLFMLIFPIKAKYFCMILVGMELFQGFFYASAAQAWSYLGAMFFGFLFMWALSKPGFAQFYDALGKKGTGSEKRRGRAKLKIVRDEKDKKKDDSAPPKYWQ